MMGEIYPKIIGIILAAGALTTAVLGQETPRQTVDMPGPAARSPGGLYDVELLAVTGSYSYSRVAVPDEASGGDDILATTLIGLNFSWNRFVTSQVTFGGSLGFSDVIQTMSRAVLVENDQFWFGPRAGYYWGGRTSRLLPYAAAECDFLAARHDKASSILGFKAGGGIIFRPYAGFGIVLDISYRETTMQTDIAGAAVNLGLAGIIF
jgi:hypothetical protein